MLADTLSEITEKVVNEFNPLSELQINWRPEEGSWSIGQCIHHLIVSNGKYVPVLNAITVKNHRMTFWEKYNPLARYTGRKMVEVLGPRVVQKYKSPKLFKPSGEKFSANIIEEFKNNQHTLYNLFVELEKEKYFSVRLTSPVAGLITFPVHDAIALIIAHERRHLNQAIAVKTLSEFPQ